MSFKRKLLALLALTMALSMVVLTGIASGQGAVKNPDTLVLVRFGDPETLDPAYGYDTASSEVYLWNIYETLIFFNGGSTGTFVPMLASVVPSVANGGISNGGKTYKFTLRSGLKFSDGSAVSVEDVKYSLLRFMFMDRDGGPSWILLSPILGVDVTRDDKGNLNSALFNQANQAITTSGSTISITLKEPYAAFMSIMAQWSMVVSKQFVVSNGGWDGSAAGVAKLNNPAKPEDTTLFSKAMGTGPFKLVQWDRQTRQAILERNSTYWRAPAKLARVIYKVVEDFGPRRLSLQQGDADIVSVNRVEQSQVEGLQGVRIVDNLPQLVVTGIYMNLKIDTTGGNPDVGSGRLDGNGVPGNFFADVNVRRGIAYAFDYASAIRDCNRNKASVNRGPIPQGMFGYNPNQPWYTTDPAKAAAAFREAAGGQVWNNGFKFTIAFNSGNTTRQCMGQILKANVESLNPKFKVDVRGVTWAQYLSLYRQSKLPMWIIGWAADYPDPDNFVTPFQMSSGTYGSAQGYNNPEVDKLIVAARNETDAAKRRAIYFKLMEISFNDATTLYLQPTGFIVMRSWVRGWYNNPAFFGPYVYPMSKG
ncbi:MAG TPA: ABC transporter substrate-binding protein [bacterium]|jgi:peptide/nickel transport system substrate-binding protein